MFAQIHETRSLKASENGLGGGFFGCGIAGQECGEVDEGDFEIGFGDGGGYGVGFHCWVVGWVVMKGDTTGREFCGGR